MAATGTGRDDDSSSCYSTSSGDEDDMAGPERDRRRLLRAGSDPRSTNYAAPIPAASSPAAGVYPQLHTLAPGGQAVVAASNLAQPHTNTRYGSVSSSSLPSSGRQKPKVKRYRLPFLILLVFDCGLVIFLSIISYDSKVCEQTI